MELCLRGDDKNKTSPRVGPSATYGALADALSGSVKERLRAFFEDLIGAVCPIELDQYERLLKRLSRSAGSRPLAIRGNLNAL